MPIAVFYYAIRDCLQRLCLLTGRDIMPAICFAACIWHCRQNQKFGLLHNAKVWTVFCPQQPRKLPPASTDFPCQNKGKISFALKHYKNSKKLLAL
jgi:hypothetical protein